MAGTAGRKPEGRVRAILLIQENLPQISRDRAREGDAEYEISYFKKYYLISPKLDVTLAEARREEKTPTFIGY